MKQYLDLLKHIQKHGTTKADRTGTGTKSIFGYQMRFDLQDGFPLVTTKKIHIKSVIHELLWFLSGQTNIHYLKQHNVKIWDAWATETGELGPIYGQQWRAWQTPDGRVIDQMAEVVEKIKHQPDSRRLIVSAWNPADLPDETLPPVENARSNKAALPPCHTLFQFYVADNKLSCILTQRSADVFLGVPFNIASYALLTHMVAQQCHLEVGEFIWSGGDCHIYSNHHRQIQLQLSRQPHPLPELVIKRKPENLFDYQFDDFEIKNYQFHPLIKGSVAV